MGRPVAASITVPTRDAVLLAESVIAPMPLAIVSSVNPEIDYVTGLNPASLTGSSLMIGLLKVADSPTESCRVFNGMMIKQRII
jgi:hypothetical protein